MQTNEIHGDVTVIGGGVAGLAAAGFSQGPGGRFGCSSSHTRLEAAHKQNFMTAST